MNTHGESIKARTIRRNKRRAVTIPIRKYLFGRRASNGEIAAAPFVSEATVKSHFGNILTRLDLRDHAAGIVCAHARPGPIPCPDTLARISHPGSATEHSAVSCEL